MKKYCVEFANSVKLKRPLVTLVMLILIILYIGKITFQVNDNIERITIFYMLVYFPILYHLNTASSAGFVKLKKRISMMRFLMR